MQRSILGLAALLSLSLAPYAAAADVGETVHLNEGWYRVEPPGVQAEGFLGTLEVGPAPPSPAPSSPSEEAAPLRAEQESPAPVTSKQEESEEPCRHERGRYLQELFRIAGIWHFPMALELVEALGETPGFIGMSPWLRFNLFGEALPGLGIGTPAGVDPIRPLGWDEKLRWAAEDLLRCSAVAS